jgi:hypothetical protein
MMVAAVFGGQAGSARRGERERIANPTNEPGTPGEELVNSPLA